MSVRFILTLRIGGSRFLSTLYGFLTQCGRIVMCRDMDRPSYEVDSRYINAPTWPWAVAGWTVSALHVVFFVVAWIHRTA